MDTVLLLILILPWKIIFLFLLILGSLFAISAPSWLAAWIGLEINILALIAILIRSKSPRNSEAALKYFLVQALASSILISRVFGVRFSLWSIRRLSLFMSLIILRLLIKIGRAPFHFWVPQVVEGLQWINNLIILIWQKFAPFILSAACLERKTRKFILVLAVSLSAVIGALGGLAQTSTRKILAFSSINHIGWMLTGIIFKISSWFIYYITYSLILSILIITILTSNLNSISNSASSFSPQQTLIFFSILLSFGGLPPFLGFGPKWLIIFEAGPNYKILVLILILSRLITLFFYLRLAAQSLLIKKRESIFLPSLSSSIWTYSFVINLLGLIVLGPLFIF